MTPPAEARRIIEFNNAAGEVLSCYELQDGDLVLADSLKPFIRTREWFYRGARNLEGQAK